MCRERRWFLVNVSPQVVHMMFFSSCNRILCSESFCLVENDLGHLLQENLFWLEAWLVVAKRMSLLESILWLWTMSRWKVKVLKLNKFFWQILQTRLRSLCAFSTWSVKENLWFNLNENVYLDNLTVVLFKLFYNFSFISSCTYWDWKRNKNSFSNNKSFKLQLIGKDSLECTNLQEVTFGDYVK